MYCLLKKYLTHRLIYALCRTIMSSPDPNLVKQELFEDISSAVREYADDYEIKKLKCLERYDPEKVATILFLSAQGKSINNMVSKYGFKHETVQRVLVSYADYMGKWRDLGGQLAAYSYLNITSLEEEIINDVRSRMQSGELKPTFKDIKDISIAKSNSSREAMLARGEATSISREEKGYTDEDYKSLMEKAKNKIKQAEVIDVDNT